MSRWEPLIISDSGSPIDQLLKPFEILENTRLFAKECTHGLNYCAESHTFKDLLERLRELDEVDDATGCFKHTFHSTWHLEDWFRWYRLGCRLIEIGDWSRAIPVLSNARWVVLETAPMWSKVFMISHKLQDALTLGGPLLYQRQVERWMPWLKEWQSEQ